MKTRVLVIVDDAVLDDVVVSRDVDPVVTCVSLFNALQVIVTAADADSIRCITGTIEDWGLARICPDSDKAPGLCSLRQAQLGGAEDVDTAAQHYETVRANRAQSF